MALHLRRLLLEDVAREGMPTTHLALGGELEALLGARVRLHLRHDEPGRIAAHRRDPAGCPPCICPACCPPACSPCCSSRRRPRRRTATRWPTAAGRRPTPPRASRSPSRCS